jgi:hypothetical protein
MHQFIRVSNGLILDESPISEESLMAIFGFEGIYYSRDTALEKGWYPVQRITPDEFSERYQKMRDTMVIDEENKKVVWTIYVEDKTQAELDEQDEIKRNEIRQARDLKLAATDWRVARANESGVPLAQEWVDYRQALRDITEQPDPWNTEWPEEPGNPWQPIPADTEYAPAEISNGTPVLIEGVNYFPDQEGPSAT